MIQRWYRIFDKQGCCSYDHECSTLTHQILIEQKKPDDCPTHHGIGGLHNCTPEEVGKIQHIMTFDTIKPGMLCDISERISIERLIF